MTEDQQHLDLLAVFHYVLGGLVALFSCFPLIHVAIGIAMLSGGFDGNNPPPKIFAWFFILLPSVFIFVGWALAVAMVLAGRKLKKRMAWTYCLVVAGVECAIVPFGTVLGVFTIIVLARESVKGLFSPKAAGLDALPQR